MRELDLKLVTKTVKVLALSACIEIGSDVLNKLKKLKETEASPLGKNVLEKIIENDDYACLNNKPMCQDTGICVVFLEIGNQVVYNGDIYEAINQGVREAYTEGYLRKSVVRHPLDRVNTLDNTPAIIHTTLTQGEKVKITVAPKGAGSENVSLVKMLIPSDGVDGIKKLVYDTVNNAGGKPCPPIVIGLGIGGDLEKSAILAKEALLRDLDDINPDPILARLENEILEGVNKLGIGPMGFGGTNTCLAVKINSYPCHIASLPVAINIQCHAARHKSMII